MADIDAIVAGLVVAEKATPGVRQAFQYAPPALISQFPTFLNLVGPGDVLTPRVGQGVRESTVHIKAIALVANQADSADAERQIRPLIYNFISTLDNPYKTLGGVTHVLSADVVGWEDPGPYTVHGQEGAFLAVPFNVQVTVLEPAVTYSSTGT